MASTVKLVFIAYLSQISVFTYGKPADYANLLGDDYYPEVDEYDPSLTPIDDEYELSLLPPEGEAPERFPDPDFPVFPEGEAIPGFQYTGGYFEGDILEEPGTESFERAGSYNNVWDRGIIYYRLDNDLNSNSYKRAIQQAMSHIESLTCVRFQENYNTYDYMIIFYGNGCFSEVGKKGGKQRFSLGNGCWDKSTIVHELIHAIGFWHEQSRSDRDNWVDIHWNNIPQQNHREFNKWQTNYFGTDYDYRSIMHYYYDDFSARGRGHATITPKDSNVPYKALGAGDGYGGMTSTDALQINRMYRC